MEREYRDDRSGLEKGAHTHTQCGEWKEVSIFFNEKKRIGIQVFFLMKGWKKRYGIQVFFLMKRWKKTYWYTGDRFRSCDLEVMSLARYLCATPVKFPLQVSILLPPGYEPGALPTELRRRKVAQVPWCTDAKYENTGDRVWTYDLGIFWLCQNVPRATSAPHRLIPPTGFDPVATRLWAWRSTAELRWLWSAQVPWCTDAKYENTGDRVWTYDLEVMSLARYLCATPVNATYRFWSCDPLDYESSALPLS